MPKQKIYADREYVNTQITNLVNSAPETLDTLGELATALQQNNDVVEVLNEAIGGKANKSELKHLAFTDTVVKTDLESSVQASLDKADTALQSFKETDPTVPAWAKAATKPTYTASEVGADANGTASSLVATHNSTIDAHVDIRNQVKQISEEKADNANVFEVTEQPMFTNVFDTVGIEYGKALGSSGVAEDSTGPVAVTDFIPFVKGQTIRVKDFALYTRGDTPCIILYGADKTTVKAYVNMKNIDAMSYYVGNIVRDTNGDVIQISILNPGSLAYIRICNHTSVIGKNPVLTIDEPIEYEIGYGTKLNSAVEVDYNQIINAPKKTGWNILPNERLNIAYSHIGRKPINTIAHFIDAAENYGYNALKCDIRPTSDGELVCCHDAGYTFTSNGYITTYDASNATAIRNVTAATVLGYQFSTGDHPCLVGDYLDVCRKYGKVAFITIRNEYMDVVIPKLLEELRIHNMTYSAIINCMTYESLVQWRQQDQAVMINYTLNAGVAIDQAQIDRAIGLGYCSLCGFGLNSSILEPTNTCDFEYARENGIRLLQAIASQEGSAEACYALGYDGCQIAYPWGSATNGGISVDDVQTMIDNAISAAIGGAY